MDRHRLRAVVERQVDQGDRAARERRSVLSRTLSFGTVGLMLVLPIVGGAYLGRWLDEHVKGFSFSWTISLILIGVGVGAANTALFIRRTWV